MTTSRLRGVSVRHELKLWTDHFVAMQLGNKRADVRRCDDREFRRGDELLYRDFSARSASYSGMALLARVTHITRAAGLLDLFGRDMSPAQQDDRPISQCILGAGARGPLRPGAQFSEHCSQPYACTAASKCLEAWEPRRELVPIVVLSIEVLEIGKYEALSGTTPQATPAAPTGRHP